MIAFAHLLADVNAHKPCTDGFRWLKGHSAQGDIPLTPDRLRRLYNTCPMPGWLVWHALGVIKRLHGEWDSPVGSWGAKFLNTVLCNLIREYIADAHNEGTTDEMKSLIEHWQKFVFRATQRMGYLTIASYTSAYYKSGFANRVAKLIGEKTPVYGIKYPHSEQEPLYHEGSAGRVLYLLFQAQTLLDLQNFPFITIPKARSVLRHYLDGIDFWNKTIAMLEDMEKSGYLFAYEGGD